MSIPISAATPNSANVLVLKLNDPSSPVHNLPQASSLHSDALNANANLAAGAVVPHFNQPHYHDIMWKMYNGCHVQSSSVQIRATPRIHLNEGVYSGAAAGELAETVTNLASERPGYDFNTVYSQQVATPFRLVITKDEDAYEDLLPTHQAYKSRLQDATFSGIKTQRTTFHSAVNTGEYGKYTRPLSETYVCRRFWDLPRTVKSYHTKYHRTIGSRRRLIADEPSSGGVNLPGTTGLSTDTKIENASRFADLMRYTKPWNAYAGENKVLADSAYENSTGYRPSQAAFVRIQALPTDGTNANHPHVQPNNMIKLEIKMKFHCIFFDRTELAMPTDGQDEDFTSLGRDADEPAADAALGEDIII